MTTPTKAVGKVDVIQTAKDTDDRLAALEAFELSETADVSSAAVIRVDPDKSYQKIVGFGGAFTEAGADTLSRMSSEKRAEVIRAYFDSNSGSNYSLCRTHINSCDFSLGNYAYVEKSGDHELHSFDISRDREKLIPFIKDAMEVSGSGFKLFASPWSPPAWMKTNGEMNNGGKLSRDCLATWALYYTKYIRAYAEEGITIWGLTVQNEPAAKQRWDSCIYTAEEERDFVKFYLGPRLAAENMSDVKVMIWDHNKDVIYKWVDEILSDPDASRYIWGVGFHWYGGDEFKQLEKIHKRYPDTRLIFTEGCQEDGVKLGSWALGERYGHAIIGDINHWTAGWVDWNMVLDEQGGPNHVGNYCDAPIICDTKTDTVHYQSAYYYIGHFSRYVKPGASRIDVTSTDKRLETTAFRNPDGGVVVVIMNATDDAIDFTLQTGGASANSSIAAHAIQTLLF